MICMPNIAPATALKLSSGPHTRTQAAHHLEKISIHPVVVKACTSINIEKEKGSMAIGSPASTLLKWGKMARKVRFMCAIGCR